MLQYGINYAFLLSLSRGLRFFSFAFLIVFQSRKKLS